MIKQVGLTGFEHHYPGQLSGGMRKRAALARTLIYQPKTLLLDEPFSALDSQTRIIIQQQLKDLAVGLGLTVLLVTHDINEAIALSDRIVVFSRRPAHILDIIEMPKSAGAITKTVSPAGSAFEKIWNLLAGQIDVSAGT